MPGTGNTENRKDARKQVDALDQLLRCRGMQSNASQIGTPAGQRQGQRIARLKKECQKWDLKYKRKGVIACGCGNSFEAGGAYIFASEECVYNKKEECCAEWCAKGKGWAKKVCDECVQHKGSPKTTSVGGAAPPQTSSLDLLHN